MAQFVGGVVGAAIGFVVTGFNPMGAKVGWVLGSAIGASFQKGPTVEGPRLSDLKTQTAEYGSVVPVIYGAIRIAGNIFWATEIKEKRNKKKVKSKGGPSQVNINYTYSCSFACGICEGEILGIRRIWMNGELVFSASENASAGTIRVSNQEKENIEAGGFRVYIGSETQEPDPVMEAEDGAENTPAYRGLAYVLFDNLQLETFGNRVPNVEFEVVSASGGSLVGFRQFGSGVKDISQAVGSEPGLNVLTVSTAAPYDQGDFGNQGGATMGVSDSGDNIVYSMVRTEDATTGLVDYIPGPFQFIKQARNLVLTTNTSGDVVFRQKYGIYHSPVILNQRLPIGRLQGLHASLRYPSGTATVDAFGALTLSQVQILIGGFYFGAYPNTTYQEGTINASELLPQDLYFRGVVQQADEAALLVLASTDAWVGQTTSSANRWFKIGYSNNQAYVISSGTITTPIVVAISGRAKFFPIAHRNTIASGSNRAAFGMLESDGKNLWIVGQQGTTGSGAVSLFEINDDNDIVLKENASTSLQNFSMYADNGICRIGSPFMDTAPDFINTYFYRGWKNNFQDFTRSQAIILEGVPLDFVVEDQLSRVGYAPEEYDVSALSGDIVDGYALNAMASARANIQQLQNVYFFDPVETDGILKFVKRGGPKTFDLVEAMLGADSNDPNEPRTTIEFTRFYDIELPREISVQYLDKDADYRFGSQYSRRLLTESVSTIPFEVPMVLAPNKAKQVADTNMFNSWTERDRFKFKTNMMYASIIPSDIVGLNKEGQDFTARIVKRLEGQNGVIEFEAVQDRPELYNQIAKGVALPPTTGEEVSIPSLSFGYVFNAPALDNSINESGYYIAASGVAGRKWPGALFYESGDDSLYSLIEESFVEPGENSAIGFCLTKLEDFEGGSAIWDDTNTLDVQIQSTETLESVTEEEVLNGANAAWVNGEIIGYVEAELIGLNRYRLSRLLRGQRGTEHKIANHEAGEAFIAINQNDTQFVPDELSRVGQQRFVRIASVGVDLNASVPETFTNEGTTIKPLSPVHCVALKVGDDFEMSWIRRARINAGWNSGADVPLDEPVEKYEIDFFTDNTYSTLVSTKTVESSTVYVYTEAEQLADFGVALSEVYAIIYQVSNRVGRGFPSTFENQP